MGVALVGLIGSLLWRRQRRSKAASGSRAGGYGPERPELDISEPRKELDVSSKDPPFEMEQPHVVNELEAQGVHDENESSSRKG